jgi:FkbM family methyltransferase
MCGKSLANTADFFNHLENEYHQSAKNSWPRFDFEPYPAYLNIGEKMKIHGVPALRFISSRFLWATKLSSFFTIKTQSGYKLRFYPSPVSTALWCNPGFYSKEDALLERYLRPGDVFVDVGANVGGFTLKASSIVGERGTVFSIEAHPKTIRYLRGNLELNSAKNVRVFQTAVGDRKGVVHFTTQRCDDANHVSESGVEVPICTLDSLIPDVPVRLLKIDVEGFELFVLRGAERVLKQTDLIYFESYDQFFSRFGCSVADIVAFLAERGFELNRPKTHRSLLPENILAMSSRLAANDAC